MRMQYSYVLIKNVKCPHVYIKESTQIIIIIDSKFKKFETSERVYAFRGIKIIGVVDVARLFAKKETRNTQFIQRQPHAFCRRHAQCFASHFAWFAMELSLMRTLIICSKPKNVLLLRHVRSLMTQSNVNLYKDPPV